MRIARVFAVAALATAAAAGAAPGAYAAETAAEVSPRTVAPGGMVTVSVSCPYADRGYYPDSISASSQAFEGGTVRLHKVDNAAIPGVGPAYNGTARIAPNANFTSSGPNPVGHISEWGVDGTCPGGSQWNASFTVARNAPTHYGVRGGIGGSFTDSTQTMLTGAVLVLGALGATYYVIRRRQNDTES
ncbi:hypothetical protein H9Y04_12505 [Streptomyces sp. TRM66268-LWL]|uniref:Uncharacterized protein n=1 Tax=Streptomyces polyasparticus TaxID=2767826 RepID=A0ABR7SD24_9ACTN|nr:hypothetical protein [Streptomyces polyasparticus]MBC9713391.1 hypothetical protein [Streptomyces polyasparticus]